MNVSKYNSPQNQSNRTPARKNKVGPKELFCSVCEYRTVRPYRIKEHMATHNGERNFACRICKKTYITSQNVKRHFSTSHSQSKPYKCDICAVAFSRFDHYRQHIMNQKHAKNIVKQSGTETSEKVRHNPPSSSLVQSRPDAPNAGTYTGEKPKATGGAQLEKTGILSSEKSSNPTHPELPEQITAENINEQCPTNNTENQEQSWIDIEHERTPTKIEALRLQQPFTNNAAELDTSSARIETFPNDQSNREMFQNDTVLQKMPCPGLMHQADHNNDDLINNPDDTDDSAFHKENTAIPEELNLYISQLLAPEDLNLYSYQLSASEHLSYYYTGNL